MLAFFTTTDAIKNAIVGHYNMYLVVISYLVAVLTSFVALEIASYLRKAETKRIFWILAGGAFAMGAGIFTMHFIGMLAFIMPMQVGYNVYVTLVSLMAAITASAVALYVVCTKNPSYLRPIYGGIIMGIGIAGMHYIGMSSMTGTTISYIPLYFWLSILIAITASIAALWLMLKCDNGLQMPKYYFKGVASLIMGAAICGMHYTGMAAAVILQDASIPATHRYTISPEGLSFILGCLAAIILIVGLYIIGRHLSILLKLLFGFLIILLMMIPVIFIYIESIKAISNSFIVIIDTEFPTIISLFEMELRSSSIIEMGSDLSMEDLRNDWEKKKSALNNAVKELNYHEHSYLEMLGKDIPSDIKQLIPSSIHTLVLNLISGIENNQPVREIEEIKRKLKAAGLALNLFIEHQIELENKNLEQLQKNALLVRQETDNLTISVIVAVTLLSLFLSFFISLRISKAIKQVRISSQDIAKGHFHNRIKIESEDEVGQLAKSFNEMASSLESTSKQRDEYIGMATHDLRMPVSVVIEASSLLGAQVLGPLNPKQLNLMQMIRKASSSMLSLLDELLAVHTYKANLIQINPKKIELLQFIENIYNFYLLLAEKKQISLKLDYHVDQTEAFFDELKISQVINNFLSNALKFSNPHSMVRMEVSKQGNDLKVEVHDEAGGIPEMERSKVFTWFSKISVKSTGGETSHGLGLAICKEIIQAHNGSIGFKSDYGKGSVFFFQIKAFNTTSKK